MAPCAHMSSGRLSRGLLLLCVLLGTGLCHTDAVTTSFSQDTGTSPPTATSNWTTQSMEGNYTAITQHCWDYFVYLMRNVMTSELCEWKVISRPYSELQRCLEEWAERLNHSYPNALAEQYIFQSHHRYFHNCTLEHPVYFDPPEDVLLAMIIAPICLIPFLVTLVIWRSKDGKAQA
ncbi:receptor activity-modifying protein 2 [Pyrgilauda ruficollis]|uniref:receptor activity-modifying protein 2 n=1 Tax=Onychostruthus taczanowskii TaxID=356909 RepID=UPI001B8027D8|nr:receptor activity-modifying protein 2 [Onychostruthus taczanowskii]XP_041282275.1 receptor activity-modifying protein 2 [Onychostruthus taczanowskii]XP_041319017.1 receptor activity-modifying protein 2 [Pyrgilauda ruficollis]XP_041319018.1 receptor activity-modifying protein 2 [Pyrgilauda ruficollis]